MNTTLVCKFATTSVHEHMPELRRDTANLLCHTEKTAQTYCLVDKQKKAFETSLQVRKAMRTNFSAPDEIVDNHSKLSSLPLSKDEIKEIFCLETQNGSISIAAIRERVSSDTRLNIVGWTDKLEKALLDTVRYIIKTKPAATISKPAVAGANDNAIRNKEVLLKEMVAGNIISPTPMKFEKKSALISAAGNSCFRDFKLLPTRKRALYSDAEIKLIWECLEELIDTDEPIIKSEAEKLIQSKEKMQPLIEKFGIKSLLIKVRTERDKR